jgi:hypothetical protein
MSHRVWVISDLQVPYQDQKAVDAVAAAIVLLREENDRVLTIGDEMDMQTISRWSRGTPTEYERSIGKDRDATVKVLQQLGVTDMCRSNHTDRFWNYLMKNAPGLVGAPEFTLEAFLKLDELGITFHKEAWQFAPGWLAMHGDEAGLSQIAGTTAAGLTKKTGMSVICGHTHRLGAQPYTFGVNGKITRTLFGIECGNLMDMRQALYAKTHNWQQGFAVMHIDGNKVHPELVPIVNKSFVVMGERFSW